MTVNKLLPARVSVGVGTSWQMGARPHSAGWSGTSEFLLPLPIPEAPSGYCDTKVAKCTQGPWDPAEDHLVGTFPKLEVGAAPPTGANKGRLEAWAAVVHLVFCVERLATS